MLNKLLSFIREYDMVHSGDTVVCAVSGGADSVALLMAMYLLKDKLSIHLEAAHFNHNLRGAESDEDEQFVRRICDRYDIPLHVGAAAVKAGEKGLEAAAREARYAFFKTIPGKIATAHTADDNAETVLMHLVRGTGLKGLGGISPVRQDLIRPMLSVTRQEVLEFLDGYYMPFREDSSNDSDRFLRNRLRHHVMPLLKAENPRLAENVSAMSLRLRRDEQALSQMGWTSDALSVAAVGALPAAQRSRVIASFLEKCGVKEPEAEHIALAESLIFSRKPSARASFPGGVTLSRRYDALTVQTPNEPVGEYVLNDSGETQIPELGLRVYCRQLRAPEAGGFCVQPVGDVVIRARQAGDEIRLAGGRKSLKKLFIDRKIPAADRCRIPVLCDAQGILGVWGIGVNLDREVRNGPCVQICFEEL